MGEPGLAWLTGLPRQIAELERHWAIEFGRPARRGSENHRSRPWNPSRRHANEVFLHGREMRTRGEKKHDREAIAHRRGPRGES